MQPYVIRQGDYLALLAHKFGFDIHRVWNDPANAELKQKRSDPNQLWPTDILQVPTPASPQKYTLITGATNTFTSDPPLVDVTIRFTENSLASRGLTVPELPHVTGLRTDSGGSVTISIPVSQKKFTIVFDDDTIFAGRLGHLDPINTFSGVVHRLQNLGYLDADNDYGVSDLDEVRIALRVMKPNAAQQADASGDSGAAASWGDATSHDSMSPDAATDSGDDPPPDPPDDGGMDDDGLLDDATRKMLVTAHGC
jgi:hypothetical protein